MASTVTQYYLISERKLNELKDKALPDTNGVVVSSGNQVTSAEGDESIGDGVKHDDDGIGVDSIGGIGNGGVDSSTKYSLVGSSMSDATISDDSGLKMDKSTYCDLSGSLSSMTSEIDVGGSEESSKGGFKLDGAGAAVDEAAGKKAGIAGSKRRNNQAQINQSRITSIHAKRHKLEAEWIRF